MAKKRRKITYAGRVVRVSIYTPPNGTDAPSVRRTKRKASSAALQVHNRKLSREKAEDLLAENFDTGDIMVTLTYDDAHYPESRQIAEARLKRWIGVVRRSFRAMKQKEPVMFWVTECRHGDARFHHHVVVQCGKKSYKILRSLWRWGVDVDIVKIRVDAEKNYESLARYLTKEAPERVGKHQWHISRNASRPDVVSDWVDAGTRIDVPQDALMLTCGSVVDYSVGAYGVWAVYLLPRRRRAAGKNG